MSSVKPRHHAGLISIVIPARNEAGRLPACVEALRLSAEACETPIEILVVNNRSTDETAQVAERLGCLVLNDDTKNLAHVRNTGVRASSGAIVVTVDADSLVSPNMLSEISKAMAESSVVGGGVLILPERWSLGILLTGLFLAILALWFRITGGLFFFRRSDFDAIGGFNEELVSAEDIDFARRLRQHAHRTERRFVNLLRAHIVTSCRKFDTFGDWYFILRPWRVAKLLRGRHQGLADEVWYEYREK